MKGIDGVISVDRLGLEKVCAQAARHAEDDKVSRPGIQRFLGAVRAPRQQGRVHHDLGFLEGGARERVARVR